MIWALRGGASPLSTETCPLSTEGWTRRVHFLREGGGWGGACQGVPERGERREVAGVVVGGVKCAATGCSPTPSLPY